MKMYKPFRATIRCAGRTYRWHPGWGKTAGFVKRAHTTTIVILVAHVTLKQNKTNNEVKKQNGPVHYRFHTTQSMRRIIPFSRKYFSDKKDLHIS